MGIKLLVIELLSYWVTTYWSLDLPELKNLTINPDATPATTDKITSSSLEKSSSPFMIAWSWEISNEARVNPRI
jgi:hypothetical protein